MDINEQFYIDKSRRGHSVIKSESIFISDNDFGMFSNNPKGWINYYLSLFAKMSKEKKLTFRIYQTAHGVRAFIINELNVKNPVDLLRSLSSDPLYVMIFQREKTFGCRISPKAAKHPDQFAITKYLSTIGPDSMIKEVDQLVEFHDQKTKAFSNFTLV